MNPLWVLKTRAILDSSRKSYFSKLNRLTLGLFGEIGGFKMPSGYYAGLGPGLFSCLHGGVYFLAYEKLKGLRPFALKAQLDDIEIASYSFLSKISATVSTYPLQLLRSRLQDARGDTTGKLYNNGMLEAISRIYSREGVRGFYKGILTSFLKIVPSSMITLVVYEKVQKSLSC
ncbi:hypothetical protein DI09_17p110 [Mitosporidium daphniae]|uniref:Mitochondrial carrier protein n=1 Tax=Mitosporidium daphniae TaxID=1485682 RepID=A0A098VXE2_9MICR|nr:uncharacterized protein DI09_17p110 [Mitosporidium daphniae]KGG52381.1 hypothetical protein DI09_17p110 [Mitosporidium daphniae]|eukprot:XP_013238808.1 uncharacterized protein DI09_17p110 [Mitosporidium daphniae]